LLAIHSALELGNEPLHTSDALGLVFAQEIFKKRRCVQENTILELYKATQTLDFITEAIELVNQGCLPILG
jgi:hypothetical protein